LNRRPPDTPAPRNDMPSQIEHIDAHGVPWTACGPFADPRVMAPYLGQVYIDVPYDDALPEYQVVRDYLEHADGTMRHAWKRRAEDF
jgi:hypothetical protein